MHAEMIMQVMGIVTIDKGGSVAQYEMLNPEKIPESVKELVLKRVSEWKFELTDTQEKLVPFEGNAAVLISAKMLEKDKFNMRIKHESVYIKDMDIPDESTLRIKEFVPLKVSNAVSIGSGGAKIHVAVKVNKNGIAEDIVVVEVRLRNYEKEMMKKWSYEFERATLVAVRKYKFIPPTVGPESGNEYWSAEFVLDQFVNKRGIEYGEWDIYTRGKKINSME